MKKIANICITFIYLISPFLMGASLPAKSKDVMIAMKLYEGFRSETSHPAKVTSSYYLVQIPQKDFFYDRVVKKEEETLKRVFNLIDINQMTLAYMRMPKYNTKTPAQVIILNGRKLMLQLSGVPSQQDKFKVEVFADDKVKRSLLDSEIILPEKKSTVLGFEDTEGHIYFLAFHRTKDVPSPPLPSSPPSISSPSPPPSQPSPPLKKKGNVIKEIKKPRLIHKVNPKYPKVAITACVEGSVVIEAVTDLAGDVVDAKIISGHPLLRTAALKAVQQWKYEPFVIDGEKKAVKFNVVMNFELPKRKSDKPIPISTSQKPRLIKKVVPHYPEELVKAKIQGMIVLEATTDKAGNVIDAKVIEGQPQLNQLAIDAIKQWKYEPFVINGEKKTVKFTVVVKFNLKDSGKNKK